MRMKRLIDISLKDSRHSHALCALILILFLSIAPAILSSPVRAAEYVLPDEAKLKAQRIKYEQHKVNAWGDVHVLHKEGTLTADEIEYDENMKTITAKGNVRMTQEGETIFGDRLIYHMDSERAILWNAYGATSRIESDNKKMTGKLYFWARKLVREKKYMWLEKGIFTTCDLPKPDLHYHFTTKEAVIYPGDEIIAKKVGVYRHNQLLLNRPLLRISLQKKDKKQDYFPTAGYNNMDGYYVKENLNFNAGKDKPGNLKLDWYQKTGIAAGVDSAYGLGKSGWGNLHWYNLSPRYESMMQQELQNAVAAGRIGKRELSNILYYTFPGNIYSGLYYSSYNYAYPQTGSIAWDGYSWYVGQAQPKYNYLYSQSTTNYAGTQYSSQFIDVAYRFNQHTRIHTGGYLTGYSGSSITSRTMSKYYGDVFSEGKYLDSILSYNSSGGTTTYSFDKLPEFTLMSKNLAVMNIPLNAALSIGNYAELPTNVKSGRTNFQISTQDLNWPIGENGHFNFGCGFRQMFFENKAAKYVVTGGAGYTHDMGLFDARLDYFYQRPEGFSPFLSDFVGKYNLAMAGIELHNKEKWNIGFYSSYDFELKNYHNLIGRLELNPWKNSYFDFGSGYDLAKKQWTNVNTQFSLDLGKGFSVNYWTLYDLMNKKWSYQDFCISKEDHDFLTRIVYRSEQREMWLQFVLKAFPYDRISIGPDADRIIQPYKFR